MCLVSFSRVTALPLSSVTCLSFISQVPRNHSRTRRSISVSDDDYELDRMITIDMTNITENNVTSVHVGVRSAGLYACSQ